MKRDAGGIRLSLALLIVTMLVALVVVPVSPAQAGVTGKKIALHPDGQIYNWKMSPDGSKIVYLAHADFTNPELELFSVPVAGGPSTKLATLGGGCCREYKIDSYSSKVLFLDESETLFAVPIGGGNSTRVSAEGHRVFDFEITPNGERAILTSAPWAPSGYVINLYSAVIGGGAPQRLNIGAPLPDGGGVGSFKLSNADGGNWRVVYMADQRFDDVFELFSVPVVPGTVPVRLNPDLAIGGDVLGFWVAPVGQRVAYLADQDTDEVRELYSVLVGGSGGVKLNGTPAPGVPFPVSFLSFNPSGTRVLYSTTDAAGVSNLFSVTVAGEPPTKLSDDFTRFSGAAITPSGQRVAYGADDETTGKPEVFVAWMAGGPTVKISHDEVSSLGAAQVRLSPNGWRALYTTKVDHSAPLLLWSVALNGQDRVQINSAATPLSSYSTTPDGDTVLWTTANSPGFVNADLYMAPITGGTPVKVNHELPGFDTVGLYAVDPASTRVVYDAKVWDSAAKNYEPTELFMSTLGVPANGVVLQGAGGEVGVWGMNGATFGAGYSVASPGSDWMVVAVGDFTSDSELDVVLQNQLTGEVAIWQLDGATLTAGYLVANPGPDWVVKGTGEFTGDSHLDLVLQHRTTGEVAIWQMTGPGLTGGFLVASPGGAWMVVAVGEFTGDSHLDLVLQNSTTGEVAIWQMTGPVLTGGLLVASPGTSWRVVAFGEFTGDGYTDLVLQNQTSGQVAIWELTGPALTGGYFVANPGLDWVVKAVGQFTLGDTDVDIVLQHATTGDVAIWQLAGTTLTAGFLVANAGSWGVKAIGNLVW